MESIKTVLVAGLADSAAVLAAAGKSTGVRAMSGCIWQLRNVAESFGGHLVGDGGDELILVFDTPDAAAAAASRMHEAVDALGPIAGVKVATRVGFHTGPVVEREGDLLGDAIKRARRLIQQAERGQTLTSEHTAALLSTPPAGLRPMYAIPLGRQGGDIRLYEITSHPGAGAHAPGAREVLQLRYGNASISCEHANPRVVIGREQACTLVVPDRFASRRHCTLELNDDGFLLRDHSRNGTYVTNEGSREILLRAARMPLAIRGWLALGQPRSPARPAVEFLGR